MADVTSHRLPLWFVKLRPSAYAPCFATPFSAGLDLKADAVFNIPAHGRVVVSTGIAINIPFGHYGKIHSRSGLATKHNIHIGAGVIDQDYTGEILILVLNLNSTPFVIGKGDRVAQIVFQPCSLFSPMQCSSLQATERGNRGFGSSDLQVEDLPRQYRQP